MMEARLTHIHTIMEAIMVTLTKSSSTLVCVEPHLTGTEMNRLPPGKYAERDLPDYSTRNFQERGFTVGIGGCVHSANIRREMLDLIVTQTCRLRKDGSNACALPALAERLQSRCAFNTGVFTSVG